jgi:hypothetical protein
MTESDLSATSMHVLGETKARFDSMKRQMEADMDQDLRNSEVLETLMDSYEAESDDSERA